MAHPRVPSVAIIGAGNRGAETYADYIARHPSDGRVVAVAEPDAERRNRLARRHGIDPARCFDHWRPLLETPQVADAVVIATPDREHVEPALLAAERGYPMLLEKPVAVDLDQLRRLDRGVRASGAHITVAHVLRYTDFFETLHRLLQGGEIGRLRAVQHHEQIGFYHFAHSYVRGNWRRQDLSAPLILAKACHDLDLLRWLVGQPCRSVRSWAARPWFRAENAPQGAPRRCTAGCPVERDCPYSAPRIYLERFAHTDGWPISVITDDPSQEGRRRALEQGPYGRCVYHCDNDVVDHQGVALTFAGGISATLQVSACTAEITRTVRFLGSHGELWGHMGRGQIEHRRFADNALRTIQTAAEGEGHAGGNDGLMRDVLARLRASLDGAPLTEARTSLHESLDSHYMAFAAELSRRNAGAAVVPESVLVDADD